MGVHQRQRPVPKGHATRPKIIVLLGYFSVRKKRTRLLATIFRYTSTAPLCDFCHSFLFLSILHFSIAAATPPRYSSPFLQSFCRSFLEGHTSRFLVRAWYFCILEAGQHNLLLTATTKELEKDGSKTSWTEGRKLKSCHSHSVWKSWSLCYH